jgi:hypothetical protein
LRCNGLAVPVEIKERTKTSLADRPCARCLNKINNAAHKLRQGCSDGAPRPFLPRVNAARAYVVATEAKALKIKAIEALQDIGDRKRKIGGKS